MDRRIDVFFFPTVRSVKEGRGGSFATQHQALSFFSLHQRSATKQGVRLFSPAQYHHVPQGSCKHTAHSASGPHRCDASVSYISMLVYDMDAGTEGEVQACLASLVQADISHVAYSSFSYNHATSYIKAPYRLLVFTSRDLRPEEFKSTRAAVHKAFNIPADLKSSAGLSHSYYVPSCPATAQPRVFAHTGTPLNVDTYVGEPAPPKVYSFTEVEDQATPSVDGFRRDVAEYLTRRAGYATETPGDQYLTRALKGEPLTTLQGERHDTVRILRGKLCGRYPDVDPEVFVEFARASLEAMDEDGRDFVGEFARDLDGFQGQMLGTREDQSSPAKPLPELDADAREAITRRIHAALENGAIGTNTERTRRAVEALVNKGPLQTLSEVETAVWLLVNAFPDYDVATYATLIEPTLAGSVVGPAHLKVLINDRFRRLQAEEEADAQILSTPREES